MATNQDRHVTQDDPVVSWRIGGLTLATLAAALWAATEVDGPVFWVSVGLVATLIVLADIDRRTMLLPDILTFPLLVAGLAVTAWLAPARFFDHAIGAAAGYAMLAFVGWLYFRFRGRDGLGLGDAKLLAAAGAWLGWQALASVVMLGAIAALVCVAFLAVIGRSIGRHQALPFGPFLCLGIWLSWLYGPVTFAW